MPKLKPEPISTDPHHTPADTSLAHHPVSPPEVPDKQPRPGAKGQSEPRARERQKGRQRMPKK
jgi:hypothetical protein